MTEKSHSFLPAVIIAAVPIVCIAIYVGAYLSLCRVTSGGKSGKVIVRIYPYQWQQEVFWLAERTESFIRQAPVVVVDEAETRLPGQ